MRRARIMNRRVIEEEYGDPGDGGRGYIGSVTGGLPTLAGREGGRVDNLTRGHRQAVDAEIPFYQVTSVTRRSLLKSRATMNSSLAFTSPRSHMWET